MPTSDELPNIDSGSFPLKRHEVSMFEFPNIRKQFSPCTNFQCACALCFQRTTDGLPAFFPIFHCDQRFPYFLESCIWMTSVRGMSTLISIPQRSPLSARQNYKACLFFNFVYFLEIHTVRCDVYFLLRVDSIHLSSVSLIHSFIFPFFFGPNVFDIICSISMWAQQLHHASHSPHENQAQVGTALIEMSMEQYSVVGCKRCGNTGNRNNQNMYSKC